MGLPWISLLIAFELDHNVDIEQVWDARPRFPKGWELKETCINHQSWAEFLVDGMPTLEDANKVKEILDNLDKLGQDLSISLRSVQ